jgi:chromosome segregation ATPase
LSWVPRKEHPLPGLSGEKAFGGFNLVGTPTVEEKSPTKSDLQSRLSLASEFADSAGRRSTQLEAENSSKTAEIGRLNFRINALTSDLVSRDHQIEVLQAQLDNLQSTVSSLKEENRVLADDLVSRDRQMRVSQAQLGELQTRFSSLREENHELIQNNSVCSAELSQQSAEYASSQARISELEELLDQHSAETLAAREYTARCRGESQYLQVKLGETESTLQREKRVSERLSSRLDTALGWIDAGLSALIQKGLSFQKKRPSPLMKHMLHGLIALKSDFKSEFKG